ncbi:hypothetical protein B566_EDAN018547 [Ephemera danica]|nr:hypothetical protein B566_EDAN018547 [Ephemera danica]
MEEETVTYERMGGVDAGHGHKFEWEMTTLAYLRCQRLHEQWQKDNRNGIKSFSVANNVKGAGIFDDIVIRLEYVVDSILGIYKVCTEVRGKVDITNILFNNANTPTFELRLKESVDAKSSSGNVVEQNSFSKQFQEKFRVFINQLEPETLIYKELQFLTKTSLDTNRPNYLHVLEKTMLQKSMQFVGLDDEEKERALEGFWKHLLNKDEKNVDESFLKSTAQKLVHSLHKEGQFLNDILAIPLHIRMLATIYYESLEEGQIVELSTWDTMQNEGKRRLIEEKLRGAEEVACQTVIPELLELNETKMCDVLSSLCDDLGLITNKNPPVFLHRTIAEYLAAKYVVTKLNDFDEEETLCRDNPLHVASLEGNVEIMIFLLRCDQSLLNKNNFKCQTAIHIACKKSKTEAVKLLLTYSDCSVKERDNLENTPLHGATKSGSTEIIKMILRHDESLLNKQNKYGKAPLHYACENKNEAAAKFLLENPDCLVNLCDSNGDTVLHSAARDCSPAVIEMILRRDKSLLNKQNERGRTPLHCACRWKCEAAVKFLLENPDCLLNLCDSHGNTVLHLAARHCSPEVIEMILRRDKSLLNKQNQHGEAPLHYACKEKNEATVKFLLENPDCLVDLCDSDGDTLLHSAARHCSPEVIEIILRRDKSLLNKQNERGRTPIHCACIHKNEAAVKFLLENPDCFVDLCDSEGDTVLHSTASRCSPEVIEMILRRDKTLLNKQNKREEAPLHCACEHGNETAVKFVLENPDCLVNLCDCIGNNVLHRAARRCSPEVIEMILRRDKSLLNKQNKREEAPLHCACEHGNEAAAKFLLENPDCLRRKYCTSLSCKSLFS